MRTIQIFLLLTMVEVVRMASVLLLDFRGLLTVLIKNVSQVLLLLVVDECSLLGAIDLVVLHILNWSLHCLVLAIRISGILVILMMHGLGSGAAVGLCTVNHTLAAVSLNLYSALDRKVLPLTLSSLVTRTRCRLGI